MRPKTLTGAMVPVVMGCALAIRDGVAQWRPALLCLLFAGLMQMAANLINDSHDFLKGTDRADRLGPERACAQGRITPHAMKWGIGVTLALAALTGLGVVATCYRTLPWHGAELVLLGALCMLFAFLYTTYLSYRGWGDLLVLLFFGLVPVGGTYYVQAATVTPEVVCASLVSGLCIDALLVVNNYRDREQDRVSGKRTLVVRWGEQVGSYLYLGVGIAAWLLCVAMVPMGVLTVDELVWAPTAYLLLHFMTWRRMVAIGKGKELNRILGETSRNMALMGLLWSLAVALYTFNHPFLFGKNQKKWLVCLAKPTLYVILHVESCKRTLYDVCSN